MLIDGDVVVSLVNACKLSVKADKMVALLMHQARDFVESVL